MVGTLGEYQLKYQNIFDLSKRQIGVKKDKSKQTNKKWIVTNLIEKKNKGNLGKEV